MRTRRAAALTTGAAILAVGLGAGSLASAQTEEPGTTPPSAPAEQPAAPEHLPKEIGESAGLSAAGSSSTLFALTVLGVDVTRTCPGRGVDPVPEHGHFVTVDVRAHMAAEMAREVSPGTDAFLPLVPEAFRIVAPDGTVQDSAATAAAWACLDDDELAPPFVEPGDLVTGKIVLDSRTSSGTVVYDPDGTGGWAWPFG
ncbi:hypothetical protein [Georgenia daeguensis]|uniref:DUF4352 domain-containing protein n=1 Tax=Georgenia daeguensis TaxID=908355 RepID=A0ABP6UJI7_9MICO